MNIEKFCAYCGKTFIAHRVNTRCCSENCSVKFIYKKKKNEQEQLHQQKIAKEFKEKEFFTVSEVCKLYNISRTALYRQIRLGKIKVLTSGKIIRICRTELEKKVSPIEQLSLAEDKTELNTPKAYFFDERDCYTMQEVCSKYKFDFKVVKKAVDSNSIPTCKRGFHVFVPRIEIDKIFNPTNKLN